MKSFLIFLMVFYYTIKIYNWLFSTNNNSVKITKNLPSIGISCDQKTHEVFERITVTSY